MVDRYNSYNRDHQETENPYHFFYYSHHSHNPSFSSTLLDTIYRSIDQGEDHHQDMVIYRRTKQGSHDANVSQAALFKTDEEIANSQRTCMIEKWIEKKAVVRRKLAGDSQTKKSRKDGGANSSSSSSDSSCGGDGGGGLFSSAEAEFPIPRPKPVRTGGGIGNGRRDKENRGTEVKPKHEGGFLKTKSRALKIYGDLKKVKQPISPGGRLAGFLNSLFNGGNFKKTKTTDYSPSLKSGNTSTCSSASSFSRSCLSKTPSSRGKSSDGGVKRSVRFSPVSVIVDEHCQPCGHKLTSEDSKPVEKQRQIPNNSEIRNSINDELMVLVREKNRRVGEIARELLRNYQKKNQEFDHDQFCFDELRKTHVKNHVFDQEFEEGDDEEDDADSYASSDLFELDNLSAIGMERYREELPVYETTHLDTNRAIANGFIL